MIAITRSKTNQADEAHGLAYAKQELKSPPTGADRRLRNGRDLSPPNGSSGGCLHELFEAQVRRKPNDVALVVGTERLTYGELNRRANCVAHRLQSLGVVPDTLVGIFFERSADMVIAIMGVLKAGGAYVPLDPAYPSGRLEFMLVDAQVHTVLTQTSLMATLVGFDVAAGRAPHIVCLDTDRAIAGASDENPHTSAQAENLAYVIYT